jgi:hypothetical protein
MGRPAARRSRDLAFAAVHSLRSGEPGRSASPQAEGLGARIETITAREYAQACGVIFDAVEQADLRHLGTPEMLAAVKGAARRELGDAWAWSRKSSAVDISPLVACTLALWKLRATAGLDEALFEVVA